MNTRCLNRTGIIQQIIDQSGARNYLEIGVARGECFLAIRARRKTGVDPAARIARKLRLRWLFRNLGTKHLRMTSDGFFQERRIDGRLDVVFIDGLHTYAQALRDVENSLHHLREGGVILLHDCNPNSASAAHPASSLAEANALNLPGWNGEWNGDVWKTVCHLRSRRNDLRVFVLDCDFGMGIVTRGRPEDSLRYSEAEISVMTYEDFAKKRQVILNLKPATYLPEFLNSLPRIYSP